MNAAAAIGATHSAYCPHISFVPSAASLSLPAFCPLRVSPSVSPLPLFHSLPLSCYESKSEGKR